MNREDIIKAFDKKDEDFIKAKVGNNTYVLEGTAWHIDEDADGTPVNMSGIAKSAEDYALDLNDILESIDGHRVKIVLDVLD